MLALFSAEVNVAKESVVHWAFYVVMIGMPITGWIMVSASRIEIPTLLYGSIPWPHIPGLPDLAPAAKKVWHDVALNAHHLIIKGAYVLIALHVAGAAPQVALGQRTMAGETILGVVGNGAPATGVMH